MIRERVVAHLRNIDEGLARTVGGKLGLKKMPEPADAAVKTRTDLPPSSALSIIGNGPKSFMGRKLGVLVADGSDGALLDAVQAAAAEEGATVELVAPKVGGFTAADGTAVAAKHMIDGGPSVLFDAVVLLLAEDGGAQLAKETAARDFVADAFAHCKFIGYTAGAAALLEKAAIPPSADEGLIVLDSAKSAAAFLKACRTLRVWSREPDVKL